MQPALAPAIHNAQAHEQVADQNLRDQLLASVQAQSGPSHQHQPQHAHLAQANLPPPHAGSHEHGSNIDPAIANSGVMNTGAESPGDDANSHSDGRKAYGKRELSTSKRAAQNRAAQRAFRQRKEGYIRKLEDENKEMKTLSESYKAIQAENYQLRDYIINLQSRLIESGRDLPLPPSNIDLSRPRMSFEPSHAIQQSEQPGEIAQGLPLQEAGRKHPEKRELNGLPAP